MRQFLKASALGMIVFGLFGMIVGCGGDVNTNCDSHFTSEGLAVKDSTDSAFVIQYPKKMKFYVEVSGSMNGFFRANKPTHFKEDLWRVITFFSNSDIEISELTNDGSLGARFTPSQFRALMNQGAFVSTASTQVPLMLKTIIDSLDTDAGEVAVLVSDMKYSPVGAAAPEVLLSQYCTDVNKILGRFGKAVSLICATSDYLDKNGNELCDRSPYYYFILGDAGRVASVRNRISTILEMQERFVDNIDSGFDYCRPRYSFGIPNRCDQLDDEPTFVGYEEMQEGVDTCSIKLKINLEEYRWLLAVKPVFKDAFKAKALYGSNVEIGDITIEDKKIREEDRFLERKTTATVVLKVFNMPTDSDVIEWTLDLPVTDTIMMKDFLVAEDENDCSKSYSVDNFIKGIFVGGLVIKPLKPNYILISKNN